MIHSQWQPQGQHPKDWPGSLPGPLTVLSTVPIQAQGYIWSRRKGLRMGGALHTRRADHPEGKREGGHQSCLRSAQPAARIVVKDPFPVLVRDLPGRRYEAFPPEPGDCSPANLAASGGDGSGPTAPARLLAPGPPGRGARGPPCAERRRWSPGSRHSSSAAAEGRQRLCGHRGPPGKAVREGREPFARMRGRTRKLLFAVASPLALRLHFRAGCVWSRGPPAGQAPGWQWAQQQGAGRAAGRTESPLLQSSQGALQPRREPLARRFLLVEEGGGEGGRGVSRRLLSLRWA